MDRHWIERLSVWSCAEWHFHASFKAALLAVSEPIRDSQRLQPVTLPSFSPSLSFSGNPQLFFVTLWRPPPSMGNQQGEGEREKYKDIVGCETLLCVCVQLECEWTGNSVWGMLHAMTTNVPVHYCFPSLGEPYLDLVSSKHWHRCFCSVIYSLLSLYDLSNMVTLWVHVWLARYSGQQFNILHATCFGNW